MWSVCTCWQGWQVRSPHTSYCLGKNQASRDPRRNCSLLQMLLWLGQSFSWHLLQQYRVLRALQEEHPCKLGEWFLHVMHWTWAPAGASIHFSENPSLAKGLKPFSAFQKYSLYPAHGWGSSFQNIWDSCSQVFWLKELDSPPADKASNRKAFGQHLQNDTFLYYPMKTQDIIWGHLSSNNVKRSFKVLRHFSTSEFGCHPE
jgi:hypothetical protein